MEPIYVTGHRNPDTDSIVSAMAYAALQNAIGKRDYVPARLGHCASRPCARRCATSITTRRPRWAAP